MNKSYPSNPKAIPWRMFFESKVQDPDDDTRYKWRTFGYKTPALAVLVGAAATATPAERYLDKPRLAHKRRRAIDRALRRGRRTQIAQALASFTGA